MINSIFIDNLKFSNYTVFPLLNGLSDHDAQLLIIKDINLQSQGHYVYTTRNINNYSINEFKIDISYETWDCVFGFNNKPDVNTLFNSFLNNYLRIFYNNFYLSKITKRHNHTPLITPGIGLPVNIKDSSIYVLKVVMTFP
jgi:hypothetical protein